MRKFSLFCVATGFVLCLFGVFIHSVVGNADKGLAILLFGFFVSAVGISVYLYVCSTAIGSKIFACGFGIGMTSLVIGKVVGMEHPLVVIFSKVGVWVAIAGAVIHIVNAVRMMRN
jgi:hypothetical protein